MTIESGLELFAEYGHDLSLLNFKEMFDAGLLNDKGIAQYNSTKNIRYGMVKPELRKVVESELCEPYLSILKEALSEKSQLK